MPEPVVAALDLGSSKVVALIAQVDKSGMLSVTGIGFAPSRGVRQGLIVDLDAARDTVLQVVRHAENMARAKMPHPAVAISGSHISCMNSSGSIALTSQPGAKGRPVTEAEVESVLANSQSVQLSIDKCMLHAVPQRFFLDGAGCVDPHGRECCRLGVDTHLVLAGVTNRGNLTRCLQLAETEARRLVFSPLADAMAALGDEDLEQGVALVNFGAGTCDALYFVDGALQHSWVFRYAGERVTRDIAAVLKTTLQEAEELKIRHGRVSTARREGDQRLTVPQVDGEGAQSVSLDMLGRVMQARVREILQHVVKEARRMSLLDGLRGGLVLTGGGAAMNGLAEYAESVTGLRARRGRCEHYIGPRGILDNPGYLTGLGLLAMEAAGLPEFSHEGFPLLDRLPVHGLESERRSGRMGGIFNMLKGRRNT
jgi:cell division protein FtsA